MAQIKLGKIGLRVRGSWEASTSYERLDVATYDGNTYICIADTTGTAVTNELFWILAAKKGDKGDRGLTGKAIEFVWQGTQLGVRQEGQSAYTYVNLKGDNGDTGLTGATGKAIEYTWQGTKLGVRQEGQANYTYVNLKGDKGDTGLTGATGATGNAIEYNWNGTSLGIRQEGESTYTYVNLKGDKGDKGETGSIENMTSTHVTNALGYTPASGINYTSGERQKLAGIEDEANKYVHPGSGTNPHGTTKSDVGLGNVEDGAKAPVGLISTTLSTTWTGSSPPYTKTQTISGITSSMDVVICPNVSSTPETAEVQRKDFGKIGKAITNNGSITFTCYKDKPTVSLPLYIKVVL